jgi:CubicO group peptidase (beta-lactamase class C family)
MGQRLRGLWGCLAFLSLLSMGASAAPDMARLHAIFPYNHGQPGCAVGVYENGAAAYMAGFGDADIKNNVPIGPDTVFNIASMSKQFTAFSILLLAKRDALALSDPITKYVPELGAYANGLTLDELLHHTGGLPDYMEVLMLKGLRVTDPAGRRDALEILRVLKAPLFSPGAQWAYSNSGYFLLAVVVERVSGESLKTFEQKNIFDPLGMHDTTIVDSYPVDLPHLAHGYVPVAHGFSILESQWEMTGDGQVHTTVRDLLRWDNNFYTGAVGGKDVIAAMLRPGRLRNGQSVDYGGGIFLGDQGGVPTVEHSGSWIGYHTDILRFPTLHFSTVVLCNRGDVNPVAATQSVAALFLNARLKKTPSREIRLLQQAALSDEPSQMPSGAYRNPQTGLFFRLQQQNGKTTLRNWGMTLPLQPVAPHVYGDGLGGYYAFDSGHRGKLPHMLAEFGATIADCTYATPWNPPSLQTYRGVYANPEAGLHFVIEGTEKQLSLDRGTDINPLKPVAPQEFETEDGMSAIRFLPSGGFAYFSFGVKLFFKPQG